jgi:hypothetical protein
MLISRLLFPVLIAIFKVAFQGGRSDLGTVAEPSLIAQQQHQFLLNVT